MQVRYMSCHRTEIDARYRNARTSILDMAGVDVPRRVRVATMFTWLLAPAGLLLILDALWELHWWGTPSAVRLVAVLAEVKDKFGIEPPALLRGRTGPDEMIVLGAAALACAFLAPMVRGGRRWARSWGLALGIATLVVGLVFIGADTTQPQDLRGYLEAVTQGESAAYLPEIRALVYPGWYGWLEDIAQGLQVLASAAATATLAIAVIWHGDYFTSKKAETVAPDEWDAAITRLRQRTQGRRD